jgi:hypothetical protein
VSPHILAWIQPTKNTPKAQTKEIEWERGKGRLGEEEHQKQNQKSTTQILTSREQEEVKGHRSHEDEVY